MQTLARPGRWQLPLLAVVLLTGVAGVSVLFLSFAEGINETRRVSLLESRVPVEMTTQSRALDRIEERIGFRPVAPSVVPVDGMELVHADSGLPPERGVSSPISSLRYAIAAEFPQPRKIVSQTADSEPDLPAPGGLELVLGVDGVRAWTVGESPLVYVLRAGAMTINVVFLTGQDPADPRVIATIDSLARALSDSLDGS